LEGTDRGLATGARALHEDVDLLHAVLLSAASGSLSSELGGEGRRLARALEADLAGGSPRDHGARRVRDRDDGVVEGALDVRLAEGYVLLFLAARLARTGRGASLGRHVFDLSWSEVIGPRGGTGPRRGLLLLLSGPSSCQPRCASDPCGCARWSWCADRA